MRPMATVGPPGLPHMMSSSSMASSNLVVTPRNGLPPRNGLMPLNGLAPNAPDPCGANCATNAACGTNDGAACGTNSGDAALIPSYVGGGRGAYRQETTYKYVGAGAGEFDILSVPASSRPNYVLLLLGCCGFLALVLPLLIWGIYHLLSTAPWIRGRAYDCDEDFSNWHNWKTKKREFCCKQSGTGCVTSTAVPFDCQVGRPELWPPIKKGWCCKHANKGCIVPTTTEIHFDCNVGFQDWPHRWSIPQKVYCCITVKRGCPTRPPSSQLVATASSLPFDCAAGFNNWQAGWSGPKQAWCCQYVNRGCPTTSLPFDCAAGFANRAQGWSPSKKAWCCQHASKGCEMSGTSSKAFDCEAGFANWQTGWSAGKRVWCCQHENKGCPAPPR